MADEERPRETTDPATEPAPRLNRRRFIAVAGAGAAAAGAIGVAALLARREAPLATDFVSRFRRGRLPSQDPENPEWRSVPGFEVTLTPQQVTLPNLAKQTINRLIVRSLNNGKEIAFHLEWEDAEPSATEAIDRFRDAVAVQLPLAEPLPVPFMGEKGNPVHILHWKASWQADIDRGFREVGAAYPNAFNDVFPEKLLGQAKASVFYPGKHAGNPLSQQRRRSPVEELSAEGFGTATTQTKQQAIGKGVYRDGRWLVAMGVPMGGGDGKARITPEKTSVAFAAWSGSDKNVGARKQWASWQVLEVEGPDSE